MDTLRFDTFAYTPASCRLLRQGEALPVQPKVLSALELFLSQPQALVTRESLSEALWPGLFVTDNSLEQVIRKLRLALGDRGRPHRFIETISGRGYRFIAEVHLTQEDSKDALKRPHTNLPPPGTDFIGRRDALAALERMMAQARLATVLGSGGVGKTALVKHFASELAWADPAAPLRARFCNLSAARDRRSVLEALRDGLSAPEDARTLEALADTLRNGSALVILDNVEQVIPEVIEVVDALYALPDTQLLVTSRKRLDLSQERCLELAPMSAPEGVALLRDRAEATRTGLGADIETQVATAIVELLEGVPLAIRLAASRLVLMSPEALLARLSERVGWLRSQSNDLPARQLSLQASVSWSWDLLSEAEQRGAARCAVFQGGLTLAAAEYHGSDAGDEDAGDLLMALRDASLLSAVDAPGEPRFTLLQPVREFALALLEGQGLLDDARQRHAAWAATLWSAIREKPEGRKQVFCERENLWVAARYATDPTHLVHCVRALYDVDLHTSDRVALGLLMDRAVEIASASAPSLLFGLLNERALLRGQYLRRPDDARRDLIWLQQLAESDPTGETDPVSMVEMTWGRLELRAGDFHAALEHFRCARERIAREDVYLLPKTRHQLAAHAHLMLGETLRMLQQSDAFLEEIERALAHIQEVGDPWLEGIVLERLGVAYLALGRLEEQEAVVRRALALHEQSGDPTNASKAKLALAKNAHNRGLLDEAEALARASLAGISSPTIRALCLDDLGVILCSQGAHEEAARCVEEAIALHQSNGEHRSAAVVTVHLALLAALRGDCSAALAVGERAVSSLRSLEPPPPYHLSEAEILCGLFAALAGQADVARSWLAHADTPSSPTPDHLPLVRAISAWLDGRTHDERSSLAAFDRAGLSHEFKLRWARILVARLGDASISSGKRW